MAAASISLVREQTERVRPPRALWVPFALGRPFGSAEDPAFQTGVIRASLGMLATATEPTIEDYPIDAPREGQAEQWSCPLSLPGPEGDQSFGQRLLTEVDSLRPWAAETRRVRGRTLFGASGAGRDQVDEVVAALAAIAETGEFPDTPAGDVEWAFDQPLLVRHLADDLRTFYHEAVTARPGTTPPNHDALNDWIFGGTVLGEVLLAVADHLTDQGSPMALLVRGLLIPEGRYNGGSAFASPAESVQARQDFGETSPI
ncbi:MAG: hypothetical protein AAF531_13500 [Actinomycetota bacterium]